MSFVGALFLSFLLTLPLAFYAWKRREVPAAKALAITMAGVSWWTLCYALELLNYFEPDLVPEPGGLRLFWFRVMFIGVCAIPAAFLVFVLQYTGVRERISARLVCWLAVEPVVVVLVALTDGTFHDWFMAGFVGLRGEQFVGGPVFGFHVLYSYVLGLVTYGLLIRFIIHSRAYRKQAVLLLFGGLMATLANLISIFSLAPGEIRGLDLTPFGFLITAVMMLLSIRSQGFLDLMPIARSLIFDHMADGVLVTDGRGRLVDRNPKAREFFESPGRELRRGEPIETLVPGLFRNAEMASEIEVHDRYLSVQENAFYGSAGKIRGVVYGFRDVTALKETEAHLREQLARNEELSRALKEESIRDPLTGLYNRRWLDEVLAQEIPRAVREGSHLTFCLIDLDHFKRINDNWGHDVGDKILLSLSQILKDGSRKHDVAARFGGEEFVLVLPGLDAGRGREAVERLLKAFTELDFGPQGPTSLTFSAGLAVVPDHATNREQLFRMADKALYEAKEAGRNRVVVLDVT